jgi:hypothetical protein
MRAVDGHGLRANGAEDVRADRVDVAARVADERDRRVHPQVVQRCAQRVEQAVRHQHDGIAGAERRRFLQVRLVVEQAQRGARRRCERGRFPRRATPDRQHVAGVRHRHRPGRSREPQAERGHEALAGGPTGERRVQLSEDATGRVAGAAEAAELTRQAGHQQRRGDALARCVADEDGELARGRDDEIVAIAADLEAGLVGGADVIAGRSGRIGRQQRFLHLASRAQVGLHPLRRAPQRDRAQSIERQRDLCRERREQLDVLGREDVLVGPLNLDRAEPSAAPQGDDQRVVSPRRIGRGHDDRRSAVQRRLGRADQPNAHARERGRLRVDGEHLTRLAGLLDVQLPAARPEEPRERVAEDPTNLGDLVRARQSTRSAREDRPRRRRLVGNQVERPPRRALRGHDESTRSRRNSRKIVSG